MSKRGYHHGNLRQALMTATLGLITEKGPTGFTLSEAAKSAGVTPAAVYRHFEGREALLAGIALQGFELFADLMEHARAKEKTPLASFMATGRAYLAFARKFPGHYMAMFEAGLSLNASADLARASKRAMGALDEAAADLSRHIAPDRRPPTQMITAHIWALSHGVVELFARGKPGTNAPYSPEDLLESGIGVYLRGLGIIGPDD